MKRLIKNIFVFILILIISSSQLLGSNSILRFTHLTTDDGLSQSNVTCIAQDKSGFMWFGTFNGLNRYNGYDFERFHYDEHSSNSLDHNFISALAVDEDGYIWVGTSDGLNRIDPELDHITSFRVDSESPESLRDHQIETILVDSQNRVWIGTRNGGLALYDRTKNNFMNFGNSQGDNIDLQSNSVRRLFEDSRQNIWIIHDNGAVDLLSNGQFSVVRIFKENGLTNNRITAIEESLDGNIWIATQGDGLYRFELNNLSLKQVAHYHTGSGDNTLNSNIILSLLFDDQNYLWIGTEDNGINLYDLSNNHISYYFHDPFDKYSLSHNSIWSIFQDIAGNIWVGTYAYGVNLLNDRNAFFEHFQHRQGDNTSLSNNMVNTFRETENGDIWVGTDGGGLNLFDRSSNTFYQINSLKAEVILSLHDTKNDKLFIGTWAEGLYLYDRKTKDISHYSQNEHGLASDNILGIEDDGNNGLWLCTFWGGLTHFYPLSGTSVVFNETNSGLKDNNVRAVMRDDHGYVWVGTDVGVDRLDPESGSFINFDSRHGLCKGFIYTITQTSNGDIWIGTNGGLNRYLPESNSFEQFTMAEGLPDNEIKCIIEGDNNTLWLSSNKGVFNFDPLSGNVEYFDHADGLQGNEFNVRSGIKTHKGEIVFGGNNGFNIFQPGILKKNTYVPPVIITGFRLFNLIVLPGDADSILQKQIRHTDKIVLSYDQDVFSFDYSALNYLSPQDNQYAYRLKGFESNWNYVNNLRSATYTNIDPGEYVFEVKASNNDGVWNEEGKSVGIMIKPPFWKTWWAYIIEILLIFGAVLFVINFFTGRQRMKNNLRLEQLELEKMYELDQMRTRFFSNISHEFHAPLTLILSPLEKLNAAQHLDDKTRESLVIVLRNAQRLERMIKQLKDIQKLETGDVSLQLSHGDIITFLRVTANSFLEYAIDHKIDFNLSFQEEHELTWFDADKVDKIIYNLLSNAFKFTPDCGSVKLTAHVIPAQSGNGHNDNKFSMRHIEISVSDTGIGIPKDKIKHVTKRFFRVESLGVQAVERDGSGIGLAFVNELIKIYHGDISVSSEEGKGSIFSVKIPLDYKYLEEHQLVGEFIDSAESEKEVYVPVPETVNIDKKKDTSGTTPGAIPLILVVEDDNELREYISNSLQKKYMIESAENGQKGLEQAKKLIPDLIITDIKMPVMDGIELCNQLKESEKTSHIPVILLTAYSSKQSKIEGLSKGADAYLTKPFNIDMLNAQILNLLSSRKKLRKKFTTEFLLGPQNADIKDVDERFLQRIVEIIENNISDNTLNAESLGHKVGMSRTQLYRKIRGLTDQTVHEFIRNIRLKRARQLLEEKRITVTEVAYAVGFNDLTYFARCFKQQYKKSPSEYISPKKRK